MVTLRPSWPDQTQMEANLFAHIIGGLDDRPILESLYDGCYRLLPLIHSFYCLGIERNQTGDFFFSIFRFRFGVVYVSTISCRYSILVVNSVGRPCNDAQTGWPEVGSRRPSGLVATLFHCGRFCEGWIYKRIR